MNEAKKVIETAKKWTGYLEKKSNADLDSLTANAGKNNYTCFARDYKIHTGQNLQGQPWCAMFVSEIFVQAFGLEAARRLLCGALYHYCPTGANRFKQAGKWSNAPEPGAVIFFTNGTRAYHTGIVTEVTSTRVKTIEGNTSGVSGVMENGGGVCEKSYALTDSRIMGYGIPDWAAIATSQPKGWVKDDTGWWYRNADGSYPKMRWKLINHHWYLFGADGYMLTGWHRWDGHAADPSDGSGDWYYLEESGDYEGACWHEKAGGKGALERWRVE